jgi:hypothetical protein
MLAYQRTIFSNKRSSDNGLYHDLNYLGHETRFLGILPVFWGSKRHFCTDSLLLVGENVAQN